MSIGFSNRMKYTLLGRRVDPEGRYLFLKVKLGVKTYTLANVYCPNRDPIVYLSQTLSRLMEFREGEVILAGDFNLCLDTALDRSSSSREASKKLLLRLGKKLHHCHLMDI